MPASNRTPEDRVTWLEAEVAMLREVLVFADGRSVAGGFRLADLYAADSDKQGVLQRAGCHPRTVRRARCPYCEQAFDLPRDLREHMDTTHPEWLGSPEDADLIDKENDK